MFSKNTATTASPNRESLGIFMCQDTAVANRYGKVCFLYFTYHELLLIRPPSTLISLPSYKPNYLYMSDYKPPRYKTPSRLYQNQFDLL